MCCTEQSTYELPKRDMEEAASAWRLLLLACLVTLWSLSVHSQSTCSATPSSVVIATNTTSPSFTMSCTVPTALQLSQVTMETWRWNRLTPSNMVDQVLTNITSTAVDVSTYQLDVNCSRGGIYEALYRAPNGTCIHSCSFFVEVEEVQVALIQSVFSVYAEANLTDGGNTLSNWTTSMVREAQNETQVSVGICSSMFFTGLSGCLLSVDGRWYKDGQVLNAQSDPLYQVSSSGELRIVSLNEGTQGDYVCVTTLPFSLGSFVTLAVNIAIAPGQQTTIPSSPMTTQPEGTLPPGATGLRAWEVGLIVANIIVVLILVGLVVLGMVCFVQRRRERPTKSVPQAKPQSQSMMEQMQLMEKEVEEVDFVGPVEIPFSSILFDELLHKGTFKVVHHAVVNFPALGIMSLPVAVKRLKDDKSELGMEELMGEAYTLRAVHDKAGSHPNVVSLVGVTTEGGPTCLLLEYIPHGRLDDFLLSLKDGPLPEWYIRFVKATSKGAYHKHVSGDLMRVLLQVAEGMKVLTDHGFIHRDLSTRTVLVGERLNVKVADPGMVHEGYYYVVTEREHYLQDMAPECLWEKRYSVWSDVWSFGILAYKVIAMETVPFPDATVSDLYDRMVGGERPQTLAAFSNEMYFLLQRCWQFIATERPSFANIITDLKDMAEKSTKHIMLNVAKEPQTGYISDTGQVFLHPLPSYVLDQPSKATKKNWRNSTTRQSIASSVDDTVYTRDTAETVLDFTQSENDDKDNYDSYLRGDLPAWKQDEEGDSSSSEQTENPRQAKGTRVWVETAGSKVYVDTPLASDEGTASEGVIIKKKKKKRGRGSKKGVVNPIAVTSARNQDGVNTNANNVWAGPTGGGSGSSNDPPSVTEEDTVARGETSEQSDSSRH